MEKIEEKEMQPMTIYFDSKSATAMGSSYRTQSTPGIYAAVISCLGWNSS
jgi:hypothetical protein